MDGENLRPLFRRAQVPRWARSLLGPPASSRVLPITELRPGRLPSSLIRALAQHLARDPWPVYSIYADLWGLSPADVAVAFDPQDSDRDRWAERARREAARLGPAHDLPLREELVADPRSLNELEGEPEDEVEDRAWRELLDRMWDGYQGVPPAQREIFLGFVDHVASLIHTCSPCEAERRARAVVAESLLAQGRSRDLSRAHSYVRQVIHHIRKVAKIS